MPKMHTTCSRPLKGAFKTNMALAPKIIYRSETDGIAKMLLITILFQIFVVSEYMFLN